MPGSVQLLSCQIGQALESQSRFVEAFQKKFIYSPLSVLSLPARESLVQASAAVFGVEA